MSETAARLQNHNQEMVKCLDQLRTQKMVLEDRVEAHSVQKAIIRRDIEKLQQSLAKVESAMENDVKKLNDCKTRLTETESGYNKVVDTLQLLLMSVKEKSSRPSE